MKNLLKFSVLLLLLSSCAIHSGYMNNSAALSESNFVYVQQNISGSSQTTNVFGIGGLNKVAVVNAAKNNMLDAYKLKSIQALVNVTVSWKKSGFLIVTTTRCTVTADIVEFR